MDFRLRRTRRFSQNVMWSAIRQTMPFPLRNARRFALANLVGDIRHSTHGALQVQSSVGDPAALAVSYPPLSSDLTAGEWNRAASANNRVEIRVR